MITVLLKKIVVAGNGGVGKTTLIRRYITGEFTLNTKITIGADFLNGDWKAEVERPRR